MSVWRQLTHGFRSLLNRRAADRDALDEVNQFLDDAVADLVAGGASPDDAIRTVRLRYGTAAAARDDLRSFGWENAVAAAASDLRYGARLLRRRPVFGAVAMLTLGLGIGSATAIFSAVSPVLFEPLAYPDADRLVTITDRSSEGAPVAVTFGTYRELLGRSRSFEALAVFKPWQPTMTGGGEPERLEGHRVTADYFQLLGIEPALGQGFDATDDRPGGRDVVILSDGLWRRRFAAESAIVGRDVELNGISFRVAGIMPRRFESVPPYTAHVWSLLQYEPSPPSFDTREWGHHLNMIGRVRAGVGLDEAGLDLDGIAANPIPERVRPPWATLEQGLTLRALEETATAGVRPALLALLGAAALLLVIACVNVTNLLLARGAQRRGELTMRTVLGAGSGRLVRQLMTEGLLLAFLGGALGLVVAQIGVGALVALSPPELPRADDIALRGPAFVFALTVTTCVGVMVGVVPALGATRRDLHGGVLEASRRTAGGHLVTRRALVVAEVGLALVLLVGAGLLLRSMLQVSAIAPGFDASHTVAMQIQTAGPRFGDDDAVHRFFAQSLDAVRQVPGVASVALTSQLPLSGHRDLYGVNVEHDPDLGAPNEALRYAVSPRYFETMGIPLIRGRSLEERDAAGAPPAVVVSEALARSVLPDRDPIGQRVHIGRTDLPWYTIVGVVGNVKQTSLAAGQEVAAYIATEQWYFADRARWMVIRSEGEPSSLVPAIKQAIWSVDRDQPIVRVSTMEDLLVRSEAQRRFALKVLQIFAWLALILAAVGLYGIVSGSVTERLHEIGIRSALGASRTHILALVIRQGMSMTAIGILIGLAAAVAASRTVTSLLFGVSRLDPVTYIAVVAVVTVASAFACAIPASRAARVDPAGTLRAD